MTDVINLYAESDRNIIGDDTTPSLTLENTSSGNIIKLQNAGGTGVQLSQISCPTTAQMVRGAAGGLDVYVGTTGAILNSTAGIGLSIISTPTTAINVSSVGTAGLFKSTASAAVVLDLSRTIVGSATVALFKVLTSTPSGALLEFGVVDKAVISTASAGATLAYGVRVKVGDTYGWLPIYSTIA